MVKVSYFCYFFQSAHTVSFSQNEWSWRVRHTKRNRSRIFDWFNSWRRKM